MGTCKLTNLVLLGLVCLAAGGVCAGRFQLGGSWEGRAESFASLSQLPSSGVVEGAPQHPWKGAALPGLQRSCLLAEGSWRGGW
jgi:hypothetical protein